MIVSGLTTKSRSPPTISSTPSSPLKKMPMSKAIWTGGRARNSRTRISGMFAFPLLRRPSQIDLIYGYLSAQIQRAAAVPQSSGRVLKAMAVCDAARWMTLTTASNSVS